MARTRAVLLALLPAITLSLSAVAAPRRALPRLKAESFRHPLDKDLTSLVQNSPVALLETVIKKAAAPPVEQMVRLDNLANALRVSEDQFPELHASFREALRILGGLRDGAVPELYVRSDPRPNAYTLAMQGGAPFVVVTSALVDGFSAAEVQAVLAHELGHLVCEHSLWFSLGNVATALAPPLPGLGAGLEGLLQSWRRAAEFSCDRAALLVAQDPDVVNAALIKLTSGSSKDVNVEAFLEQAREYERSLDAANRLVRSAMRSSLADATHPLPVKRVAELDKFAKSTQYAAIISGGTPLA